MDEVILSALLIRKSYDNDFYSRAFARFFRGSSRAPGSARITSAGTHFFLTVFGTIVLCCGLFDVCAVTGFGGSPGVFGRVLVPVDCRKRGRPSSLVSSFRKARGNFSCKRFRASENC